MAIGHGMRDRDLKRGAQAIVDYFAREGFALSPDQQIVADRAFEFAACIIVDKHHDRPSQPSLI